MLYVVATPIGNLEDMTLRGLRVLREVDLIAAEDTRRTAKLLAGHGITARMVSFHQHNLRTRLPQLLARLETGATIAVVTDAGTPGISDPGVELVQACIAKGIPIDPIPGASAPLAAAVASGFPLIPLTILGFAPRGSKDRKEWIHVLSVTSHTVTFFESPHRIARTMKDMSELLGERQIMVARELSKLHQEFIRGTATAVCPLLVDTRGEITVVVGPPEKPNNRSLDRCSAPDTWAVSEYFGHMVELAGSSRRSALSATARHFKCSSKEIYAILEQAKNVVK